MSIGAVEELGLRQQLEQEKDKVLKYREALYIVMGDLKNDHSKHEHKELTVEEVADLVGKVGKAFERLRELENQPRQVPGMCENTGCQRHAVTSIPVVRKHGEYPTAFRICQVCLERDINDQRDRIGKLEANSERLVQENVALVEEAKKYRERLQIDPGGSDKIDELEEALNQLRHRVESKKDEPSWQDMQKRIEAIRRMAKETGMAIVVLP